ncbi:hypothetical protein [Lignipirellula cremea]|uniref:Apea-like HEPN domain-containing protein n=1 Tax=Lignipirellula cremea TaxID=2528010 RepID=A0A518E0H7_9BACT|nr:hypothetical protein [Lignipirellula cremea]QDU97579.1 hypothetical protein Pla8534_54290 [Lignipirellula cremea]
MLFQTYYRLDPWKFEPPLKDFGAIQFDDPNQMFSLFMRYTHPFSEDEEPQVLVQTIHRKDDISDSVCAVFTGVAEIDWRLGGVNQDGFTSLPDAYRDFIVSLHGDMDRMASEIFNLVRWRMGIVGGPLRLQSLWSWMRWHDERKGEEVFDEHGFLNRQIVAGTFTLHMPEMQEADFGEECRSNVESLIQFQSKQPLYHDLFREAWQNQRDNPRSALVMGIAAAETGFKTALTDLNPSMSWIVENLQSPPLDRMLREYMAQLPARNQINGEVRRPPKNIISMIKKGIELRNKLVHGREETVTTEEVRLMLEAVRDLLYMLDYYRGYDWAIKRLSPEVAASLKEK